MFTQKHYEASAKVIRNVLDIAQESDKEGIYLMMNAQAFMFKQDNPRFDQAKFYAAATGKGIPNAQANSTETS